ncbi:MAG TPA: SRPBCC domain-containing protein [Gaiellaceae bacterium]|nr:SRPBCC domain-containing protein [Gaiellaceae bacterium]
MSEELKLERSFAAPPEVVFDAFTDPAAQHDLYADAPDWVVESECDLRVGGRWTISFGPPGAEPARETNVFDEVERPRLLVYRSTMELPDGRRLNTTMRVTFEPEAGATRMILIQSGFPSAQLRDEYGQGWTGILDALGRVSAARSSA